MANIYYCKKCREAYSVEKGYKGQVCPQCKGGLILAARMELDDWNYKTAEEREELKKQFDKMPDAPVKTTPKKEDSTQEEKVFVHSSQGSNHVGIDLDTFGIAIIVLSIIGAIITLIACSIIGNFFVGIAAAIGMIIVGLCNGLLLRGIGEIANLLQDIKNKQ